MDATDPISLILSFIFGTVAGSFLNVCIYRIPLKKSVVFPPSHCPECGHRIPWYHNIPILSYIILSGRCSACGSKISFQYPVVELITGILTLCMTARFGITLDSLIFLFFVYLLIVITVIDIQHQIIPDVISIPGLIAGILVSFLPGYPTPLYSFLGMIAGGGILYLVAVLYELIAGKTGMGGGDIKLLAMIGAWLGLRSIFPVIMLSSVSGAVIGTLFILWSGKDFKMRIPFGPFLSAGALCYLFFGKDILEWYFNLFV